MRIYEEFGVPLGHLSPVESGQPDLSNYKSIRDTLSSYSAQDQRCLYQYGIGIEVEAENAATINSDWWENTEDNSLRNGGIEFKTHYGTRICHLPEALYELQRVATLKKFSFSERTSVHVHLDVRMMNVEEVRTMFLLYLLFEKALFRFAGQERQSNVFCVPYGESTFCYKPTSFIALIRDAQKYTAINLHTITNFGTIEFRHMRGNVDSEYILTWVYILAHLRMFASRVPFNTFREQLIKLKTSSQFNHLKDSVFKGFSHFLTINSKEVDGAITTAKLFI